MSRPWKRRDWWRSKKNNEKTMRKKNNLIFILLFMCLGLGSLCQGQVEHYKKEYEFTQDWFTVRIPKWTEILEPFKGKPNLHYLEIGVHEGRSALWMLENILTHPTARITCLDIFIVKPTYDRFLANLKLSGFEDKTKIIKGKSQTTLRSLPLDSYDIVYIDGSHIAPDVLLDATLCWDLLKKGGIMIFDDYMWEWKLPPQERPKIAIEAFLRIFKNELQVLHQEYQIIIKKN
jgi:predicted O-methyltransferase YrrM